MKTTIKPQAFLMPLPAVLLSCGKQKQKPNIITMSWCGVLCSTPPQIGVGIVPSRYSHHLVKETGEFVINIPTEYQAHAVDYCGHISGRDRDKFADCAFTAEKGELSSSVMIKECPINIECRVVQSLMLGSHELFIGEIVSIHVDEKCLDEHRQIDLQKVKPIVYVTGARKYYGGISEFLGVGGFSVKKT